MELPTDIQRYIYEFCRPITRPDWKKGSKTGEIYKNCFQMETHYNSSHGYIKISSCDRYIEEYNYIRYYNYEFYTSNYEFWKENYLKSTGIDLL